MKVAGVEAATNRALVDELFDGNPPFRKDSPDLKQGPNAVNTSFLEATKIHLDAARQYSNAFLRSGTFFAIKTDRGTKHKRSDRSTILTTNLNRFLKRSAPYRQTLRDKFGSTISHGIGPAPWDNPWKWCNRMMAMGDVLIPSRTLISFDGMDKFALKRRYTAEQLGKMIRGPDIDSALNQDLVKKAMEWAKRQTGATTLTDNTLYNPERLVQDFKENAGAYSSDKVPTVNCWDFYFLDDASDDYGWRRRMILDTEEPSINPGTVNQIGGKNEFLFDSKDRIYARNLSEIIHFQVGNGSTVAPARYHNVRGLGHLIYSVCHLQNRMRCRFDEHVFESLMQFYTGDVTNDEAEALVKATLLDRGFVPPGLKFVGQNERWHIDLQTVQTAMQMHRQTMEDNSSSMTQDFDFAKDKQEKTATQYMGEASASQALVAAMLQEAYGLQEFEWREICRRFCLPNSKDPDVREFRKDCLSQGIPEECLDSNGWDIAADRVIGGGNKQMELAQIGLFIQNFHLFSPTAQKVILRRAAFAWSDDAAFANEVAPIAQTQASTGRTIAEAGFASLMLGGKLSVKEDIDEQGFIEGLLNDLAGVIQRVEQSGGMATAEQIFGFDTVAAKIQEHIDILGKDPEEKQAVKKYGDMLGNLTNLVKAYKQRLEEQMQKQQQQQDPESAAKVQALAMEAQTKDRIATEKHSQATIQKEEKFRQQQQHKNETHAQAVASKEATVQTDLTAKAAQTAQDLALQAEKTDQELALDKAKAEHEAGLKERSQELEARSENGGQKPKPAAAKKKSAGRKKITFERDKKGTVTGATVEEES